LEAKTLEIKMTAIYEHMGMKKTAMEWLNYWITERERVREMKEGFVNEQKGMWLPPMPKPWTQDPIFQTTYFCNVRREDDKVTRWLRQNWTPNHWPVELYDYSIVLARMLNNIPCLSSLVPFDAITDYAWLQSHLETRAAAGLQVWGGAYVVTSHGLRMPKAAYLCQRVLPAAYAALRTDQPRVVTAWGACMGSGPTLAQAHELLMQLEGLGSFMAAQVIADLKNTEGHPLQQAEDWGEWAAHGPGSLRGLEWVFGKKIPPGKFSGAIAQVASQLSAESFQALQTIGYFNMQDLQNCLCEFDKFMRVMTKTGKSKRKYEGR
jgi:hypothetical protein